MRLAPLIPLSILALTAGCTTMDSAGGTDASSASDTATTATTDKATIVKVGGAAMYSNKTIVENAMNSPEHTTLVKLLTTAGLVDTLSGPGPFTVFAPTDKAFAALPAPMTKYLMNPLNKMFLVKALKYHVVPGRLTTDELMAKIQAGGGSAMLTTAEGEQLTLTSDGSSIKITGVNGGSAYVTVGDVFQSNGVIHVVNGVLIPTLPTPTASPDDAKPSTGYEPTVTPIPPEESGTEPEEPGQ